MSSESWACNCMGPQNGEPFCPCMMRRLGVIKQNGRWIEPTKDLGPVVEGIDIDDFFRRKKVMPFSKPTPCTAVDHNAPMHLYVPPGETYIHTCSACGKVSAISPPNITFSEIEDEDAFSAESDDEILDKLGR